MLAAGCCLARRRRGTSDCRALAGRPGRQTSPPPAPAPQFQFNDSTMMRCKWNMELNLPDMEGCAA
jgi:hypothetical protein